MPDSKLSKKELEALVESITKKVVDEVMQRGATDFVPQVEYDCTGMNFRCPSVYNCVAPHSCHHAYNSPARRSAPPEKGLTPCEYIYNCDASSFTCDAQKFKCRDDFSCSNSFTG